MTSPRLTLLLAAMLIAPRAFAHAMLLQSSPAANAWVAAPEKIDLIFSEEVADGAGFTVTHAGVPVAMGRVMLAPNYSEVTASPKAALMPGDYVVSWHNAARDDGHRARGSFSFNVK